jgi:two-component system, chemotaxis family, CheB/CheR fusion protein
MNGPYHHIKDNRSMTSKLIKQKHTKLARQEKRIADLKKSLIYYKEITETIREPFIILDSKLTVVTANPAFYKKFKVKKKDTEGKRMYELGDNQWDTPELRECLERISPKKRKLNDYELTLDFPDLGRRTMLLSARQVDSKQLILLAVEDVTEQKILKLNSDIMTRNLINQRNRLQGLSDAKDEFISLASHQLRTPATIVKQYINLLTGGYVGELPKDQERMLTIANESNERQLEIIEDLLRVAKVDSGKVYLSKSPRDLSKEVESAIETLAVMFEGRGQRVLLNKPDKEMIALIDKKYMLMVLENILDNAGKYSAEDTIVNIKIEQNDGHIVISIKDKGVGIQKKDQDKLFKKFSRIQNSLSESVKGTGLGLYWVKRILDLHGGSIEVVSSKKGGSTFTVKIPVGNLK